MYLPEKCVVDDTWDIKQNNLSKRSMSQIATSIESVIDTLELLVESEPSLTKTQWARLDRSIEKLKELLTIPRNPSKVHGLDC